MPRHLTAFLPCRAGSERVKDKNTRPFADHDGGLLGVKLDTLAAVTSIHTIVLDSNDPKVLTYGLARQKTWQGHARLIVRERPDHLGASTTSTDSLIRYALDTLTGDDLLWTHVTSPLVSSTRIEEAIAAYHSRDPDRHDSLMSVTALKTFIWADNHNGPHPINYDTSPLRWPRTQDLTPLYEVNSALFIVPLSLARQRRDRIGERPLLFALDRLEAADVDWEEDFLLAETLFRSMLRGRAP